MCRMGDCGHSITQNHIRFYAWRDLVASFEYQTIPPYEVIFACFGASLRSPRCWFVFTI